MTKKLLEEALNLTGTINLDLVFIAACTAEFVGELFIKYGAKHVICVDNKNQMDEFAIDFTHNLYQRILSGEKISKAFEIAKKNTEIRFPSRASDTEQFRLIFGKD